MEENNVFKIANVIVQFLALLILFPIAFVLKVLGKIFLWTYGLDKQIEKIQKKQKQEQMAKKMKNFIENLKGDSNESD